MSLRNAGGLKTLAKGLNLLLLGKVPEAADLLSQRFQAVETADVEGSWAAARHLELMPEPKVSAVPAENRRMAVRAEKADQRHSKDAHSLREHHRGGGNPG